MVLALVGVGAGCWFRLGWLASVSVLLFFPASLRGALCGAFCGASRRLLVASGILVGLAASAALRAFYNVFAAWCCGWWCPASQAAWALILGGWWCSPAGRWRWIVSEAGRGSWASAGRCDGLRGWRWVRVLSSFRGGCDGLVRALLQALVLVVGLASGRCSPAVVAFLGL